MDIKFIGPTYDLPSRPSGLQRTVNMVPVPQEPGNERTAWVFKDIPGLVAFNTPPVVAQGWNTANELGAWTFSNADFTGLAT